MQEARQTPSQDLCDPQIWVREAGLSPQEVDCVTALMLKIIDGKCKMNQNDKDLIVRLYPFTRGLPGVHLGGDIHHLIGAALKLCDEELLAEIYEKRVLAETMISRPVMKAFKARLRREGLLPMKRFTQTRED